MSKRLCAMLGSCFFFLLAVNFTWNPNKVIKFKVPNGWPKPVFDFKANKNTVQRYVLGKELFYDPILSADSSISCENCHLSYTAFTHADHKLSHGIHGRVGSRNAPSLVNMAWNSSFMWDGGVNNLEVQPIHPITNPLEMNLELNKAVSKLQRSSHYRKKFYDAYNDSLITSAKMLKAISLFVANLVSYHSKYDSVVKKQGAQFTEAEARGYALFKKNCSSCHQEPLFTDQSFRNNGLSADTFLKDIGRMRITKNPKDSLKFKVPTLRNIEYSAPYFHDGRTLKLKDAIEHYNSQIISSPTLDPLLKNPIQLSKEEKKDILAFLKTLTDKYFLYNTQFRPNKP